MERGQSVSASSAPAVGASVGSRSAGLGTGAGGARTWHARQLSTPGSGMGIPEMLARGLLERGESLGINKTVMNAVSEIKVSNAPYSKTHSVLNMSIRGRCVFYW